MIPPRRTWCVRLTEQCFPAETLLGRLERAIKQHRPWVTINLTEPNTNGILLGEVPAPLKMGHFQHICGFALEPCIFILLINHMKCFISKFYILRKQRSRSRLFSHNQLFWDQSLTTDLAAVSDALNQRRQSRAQSIILWTKHLFTASKEYLFSCREFDEKNNNPIM